MVVDLEWTVKPQVLVTHDNLFHQGEPCILITAYKLHVEYRTATKLRQAHCGGG